MNGRNFGTKALWFFFEPWKLQVWHFYLHSFHSTSSANSVPKTLVTALLASSPIPAGGAWALTLIFLTKKHFEYCYFGTQERYKRSVELSWCIWVNFSWTRNKHEMKFDGKSILLNNYWISKLCCGESGMWLDAWGPRLSFWIFISFSWVK